MLAIANQVYSTIKIKDVEVSSMNGFHGISCFEGGTNFVACLQMIIGDTQSKFSTNELFVEGNQVEVVIAKSVQDANTVPNKFRVHSVKALNAAQGPILTVNCILDAPLFIAKANRQAIKGTSDFVLQKLAEESALKFSGPKDFNGKALNDNQTWLNTTENKLKFAFETTRHGWMDEHSCMAFYVSASGVLIYRNLTDVINTPADKIKHIFVHNALPADSDKAKKTHLVREAKDNSQSGFMSSWQNYGSTKVEQTLTGETVSYSKVPVVTPGSYLPINDVVAKSVERARYEYAPISCGNTHDHYQQALYQNIKLLALFTERVFVLINTVSTVQLFEPVIYRQADADLTKQVKNTDIYIVVAKTIVIKDATFYAEKLELARMSLVMGDKDLKTPQTFGSEKSMIPDVQLNPLSKAAAASSVLAKGLDSVSQELMNATSLLVNQRNSVVSMLSGARNTVQGVVDGIKNGTIDELSGLHSMVASANAFSDSVEHLYQNYASTALSAKRMYDTYKKLGIKGTVRGAIMSVAGGYISGVTESLSQAVGLRTVYNLFGDYKLHIPTPLKNTVIFKQYNDAVTRLDKATTTVYDHAATTWNYGVASANDKLYQSTGVHSDTAYKFNSLMNDARITSSRAQVVAGDSLVRQTVGNAPFTSTVEWSSRVTPFVDLSTDLKEVGRHESRIQGWIDGGG
jgi:hypothetical protein